MKYKLTALLFVLILSMPFVAGADSTTGGDISFDIQPKTVGVSTQSRNVMLTIQATIYDTPYLKYCGVNVKQFWWGVYEVLPYQADGKIAGAYQNYTPYDYNTDHFDLSRQVTLPARTASPTRQFYAIITCYSNFNTNGHSIVTKSSIISVNQQNSVDGGGGNGGGGTNPGANLDFNDPLQTQTIADLFDGILSFALWIGIPIAIAMIVYSGILFLFAGSNPGTVTKARTILMYSVIGLAIMLIGKGFLTLIQSILDLANG